MLSVALLGQAPYILDMRRLTQIQFESACESDISTHCESIQFNYHIYIYNMCIDAYVLYIYIYIHI